MAAVAGGLAAVNAGIGFVSAGGAAAGAVASAPVTATAAGVGMAGYAGYKGIQWVRGGGITRMRRRAMGFGRRMVQGIDKANDALASPHGQRAVQGTALIAGYFGGRDAYNAVRAAGSKNVRLKKKKDRAKREYSQLKKDFSNMHDAAKSTHSQSMAHRTTVTKPKGPKPVVTQHTQLPAHIGSVGKQTHTGRQSGMAGNCAGNQDCLRLQRLRARYGRR